MGIEYIFVICLVIAGISFIVYAIVKAQKEEAARQEQERLRNIAYEKLESEVLDSIGLSSWSIIQRIDDTISVKSKQTLDNYDAVKLLKDNNGQLEKAQRILKQKGDVFERLKKFEKTNEYKSRQDYDRIIKQVDRVIQDAAAYRVMVKYISPAGKSAYEKIIRIDQSEMRNILDNPSLLMTQTEYNKYLREQQKEAVAKKQHEYYDKVNNIIDYANAHKDSLVVKGDQNTLDKAVNDLIDRTVNSIKKIKYLDSEEWDIIGNVIDSAHEKVHETVEFNQKILDRTL